VPKPAISSINVRWTKPNRRQRFYRTDQPAARGGRSIPGLSIRLRSPRPAVGSPPHEVSLRLGFMSRPVSRMVRIDKAGETRRPPSPNSAVRAVATAYAEPISPLATDFSVRDQRVALEQGAHRPRRQQGRRRLVVHGAARPRCAEVGGVAQPHRHHVGRALGRGGHHPAAGDAFPTDRDRAQRHPVEGAERIRLGIAGTTGFSGRAGRSRCAKRLSGASRDRPPSARSGAAASPGHCRAPPAASPSLAHTGSRSDRRAPPLVVAPRVDAHIQPPRTHPLRLATDHALVAPE